MKTEPTNQYMFLVRGPCKQGYSPEQMQAHMIEVYAWIDSLTKQGIFSAAQPLTPEGKVVSGGNGISLPMASSRSRRKPLEAFSYSMCRLWMRP
jgi:hypothetical protein